MSEETRKPVKLAIQTIELPRRLCLTGFDNAADTPCRQAAAEMETMISSDPAQVGSLRQLQFIAGAIVAAIAIYMAMPLVLIRTGALPADGVLSDSDGTLVNILGFMFVGIGMGCVAISFMFKKFVVQARRKSDGEFGAYRDGVIIALALCDSPGVFGLVLAILGGVSVYCWVLWCIAVVGSIMHFPLRGPKPTH